MAALFALPAHAQTGEALVASEVSVDYTGKDPADARNQAMLQGEKEALLALLLKLTPSGQAEEIIETLDGKRISAMVKGTEVIDEKIGGNRYRARLRVSFDANEISSVIGRFTESLASGEQVLSVGAFLIIPAFEDETGAMLWEEKNPWREAWKTLALELGSGDVVVPFGDNSDMGIVSRQTLPAATYSSLAPLTSRYGVSDIVILTARYSTKGEMVLNVTKRRINRTRNEINALTYRADPQETRDMLLMRAARDVAEGLMNKKIEEAAMVAGPTGGERREVMLLASITTLASWTDLRSRLSSLPMIDRLELLAMSPKQVDMIVHYRGSPESLAGAIIAKKLRLNQRPEYWVVSRD